MTNVVTMKIPGTDEYEVPISFKTMKLEGGGVNVFARHPRFGCKWFTVTPSTFEHSKGKFDVREWSITHSFSERDENGEPLWHLPELNQCHHGTASDTIEDGIRHVKITADMDLYRTRVWDWEDRRKRETQ
jgi:hypothetical protein